MLTSRRFAGNGRLQQAAENAPPIRRGERGEAVALMQDAFVDLGYPMPITTDYGLRASDGIYGNETQATVRRFQAEHQLMQDGVAGKQTLHTLDFLIGGPPINPTKEHLRRFLISLVRR